MFCNKYNSIYNNFKMFYAGYKSIYDKFNMRCNEYNTFYKKYKMLKWNKLLECGIINRWNIQNSLAKSFKYRSLPLI